MRAISPNSTEFGIIAVDMGRQTQPDLDQQRAHIAQVLDDANATLERLDIATAINEARLRSQADQFIEALLGSVSHELRTPLASILGAATVLGTAPALQRDRKLSALVNDVRNEAERLNGDIQNLLDATRISSNGIKPRNEWTDPADIVNSAIERCRRRLKDHRLSIDVPPDLPLIHVDFCTGAAGAGADIRQCGEVFGSAVVHRGARAGPGRTDGDHRHRRGFGLTGEEKARIWDRFFRGARHTGAAGGSGLGLWVAHAFIVAQAAAPSRSPATAPAAAPRSRSGCRSLPPPWLSLKGMPMDKSAPVVLVVDDEVQIGRFLRTGFELNGFVVHEAGTGAEAIRILALRPVDLVIVDLGLPDMDGAKVVESVRAWLAVPLIVLSVRSTEAEKVHLLELGADDYVVKPFGMAELLARVKVALRRQSRAQSGEPIVRIGPLTIDLAARGVALNDKPVTLSPRNTGCSRGAGAARRQRGDAPASAQGGVGLDLLSLRHPLSADFRAQTAAEDRGQPLYAAHSGDRTRRRLPAGADRRRRRGRCGHRSLRGSKAVRIRERSGFSPFPSRPGSAAQERFRAKRIPVRVKKTR